MKKISSLLIAFSILFATVSCGKKDNPQPSTLPTGGTGGNGSATTTKTVQFYQAYVSSAASNGKTNYFYFAKNQDALVVKGTLNGSIRASNTSSACHESPISNPSFTVMSGLEYGNKYHYQIKSGNAVSSVAIVDGTFTISSTGVVTIDQQQPTTGPRIIYEDCGTAIGSFTVYCQ